jgi:hypothetical protein
LQSCPNPPPNLSPSDAATKSIAEPTACPARFLKLDCANEIAAAKENQPVFFWWSHRVADRFGLISRDRPNTAGNAAASTTAATTTATAATASTMISGRKMPDPNVVSG